MCQKKLPLFIHIAIALALCLGPSLAGLRTAVASETERAVIFDQTHSQWNAILKQYVVLHGHESRVNYGKIKAERKRLDEYLNSLQQVKKADFERFSESQRLAFLINAYNAFTVALIVDHYPVSSIKDLGTFLTSPWKIKFFDLFGEKRYLDNIEHDMVRKWFSEPRIHFALVCASKGCPALRNEAYTGDLLDKQLEQAAVNFLTDEKKNRFTPEAKRLEISSIFKWYGEDFQKKFGSVEAFIAPRITSNADDQKAIREMKATISYLDYDWSLNDEK